MTPCRFTPLLAEAAAPHPNDPSRVIVTSSVAATTVPHTGPQGTIMYAASKAAASHLSRQFAIELSDRHITANTVSPGFFPSKLASGLIEILGGEEVEGKKNPSGRLGRAEDIGGVMVNHLSNPDNIVDLMLKISHRSISAAKQAATPTAWRYKSMAERGWEGGKSGVS